MSAQKKFDDFAVEDETAIVSTGKSDTTSQFDVLSKVGTGTALTDIYDKFQKKIYLIDESTSMNDGMAPEDEINQYLWTAEVLKKFRTYILDRLEAEITNAVLDSADDDPMDVIDPDDVDAEAEARSAYDAANLDNDEELKKYIITNKLIDQANIQIERNEKFHVRTERKIEAVRGALKKFVDNRFNKFPSALVAVYGFEMSVTVHCHAGATRDQVFDAISKLNASGGTDIYKAVTFAMKEFGKRKSPVGAHHLVLVTDGEDTGATKVKEYLPTMKASNIVFDFIYIRGQHSGHDDYYAGIAKVLKEVCEATGGEYAEVSKSSDFAAKFLAVSNRKALPPARGL